LNSFMTRFCGKFSPNRASVHPPADKSMNMQQGWNSCQGKIKETSQSIKCPSVASTNKNPTTEYTRNYPGHPWW
jgi:hypothetical protein